MNGQSIEVVNISYVLVMSDIRSGMGVLGAQMAYRFNSNQWQLNYNNIHSIFHKSSGYIH